RDGEAGVGAVAAEVRRVHQGRAGGVDLRDEGVAEAEIRRLDGVLDREVRRAGLAGDVRVVGGVYGGVQAAVGAAAAEVGGVDQRGAARIELRDERVAGPDVARLDGVLNREVRRARLAGDVGVADRVDRDIGPLVLAAAAEVGRVQQSVARGIDLRHEARLPAPAPRLER